ncbi:hypothetical protein E2C01_067713 [Portunus trituberculatus]|uniref:Uncharacterized protein n=1 Tax=Portunus trituberculatus TaxID=210409 RepID=A0A5B7HUI3_PORTR|nr:hypothetical protein [Portunus trituberculatus]
MEGCLHITILELNNEPNTAGVQTAPASRPRPTTTTITTTTTTRLPRCQLAGLSSGTNTGQDASLFLLVKTARTGSFPPCRSAHHHTTPRPRKSPRHCPSLHTPAKNPRTSIPSRHHARTHTHSHA